MTDGDRRRTNNKIHTTILNGANNMTDINEIIAKHRGKKVAVIGLGVSNMPLVRLLKTWGANITVLDRSTELPEEFITDVALKFCCGDGYLDRLADGGYDIIYRTPGLYPYIPQINEAVKNGAVLSSEMELFFELCPAPITAVTGSDGKTTTTTVISKLYEAAGYRTFLGGNIGTPLLSSVGEMTANDKVVLELSSFQLITMVRSPETAVITNLSPNHLDVHKSYEEYGSAKKNIFRYQSAYGTLVVNADNAFTAECAGEANGKVLFFSRRSKPENGVYKAENGDIFFAENGREHFLFNSSEILIRGEHNVENYMAALAAVGCEIACKYGAELARSFGGVEHRNRLIETKNGVRFYDDSIGTSPTRTIATLSSFDEKVVLILGGYDKKISFEPLRKPVSEKAKAVFVCGHTAEKISAALEGCGVPITRCACFDDAFAAAAKAAKKGDAVVLSPACASFDEFKNFAERGKRFAKLVSEL